MTLALMLAAAVGFADLDALDRRIAAFTGATAGQSGGAVTPVDRRLRLANCSMAPLLSWVGQARDAVLVQCPDPASWRFAVPVFRSSVAVAPSDPPAVNRGELGIDHGRGRRLRGLAPRPVARSWRGRRVGARGAGRRWTGPDPAAARASRASRAGTRADGLIRPLLNSVRSGRPQPHRISGAARWPISDWDR